ncbi:hypothetical protein IT418_02060 [bacterium]|nr:hypothetical protein [bacterium]
MYYLLAFVLLVVAFLVASILPKSLDKEGKFLVTAVQGLIDDYFIIHTEQNLERKRLKLHKLTVSADKVLGKILAHFYIRDHSLKQQLRLSLEKNIVTYDQFKVLRQFHHMRNEVVHEGLQVYGDNEQVVYSALLVMKALLGT